MRKNKTVYVLGAGFSAGIVNELGVRVPAQEKLMEEIYKHRNHFENDYTTMKNFLVNTMGIPERYHKSIPLEDIFTPLDKCISDGISFRGITPEGAKEMRELINYLIGKTLQTILSGNIKKDYINSFAKYLVQESSIRADYQYSKFDPVTVISTNWDILLDNSIKSKLESFYKSDDIKTRGVVDYCCQISSYGPTDDSVKPGLEILGKGGFNVKLLKLHGSLNWLQCPRCNRLYVDFDNKIAISQYKDKYNCRHCDNNFGTNVSHKMVSNLIMPTFMKNLSNAQYKLIWQNSAIELSEASKIVFIGYSLPAADFEMKQLLSRMVRSDASIEVVDFGESETAPKILDIKRRYEVFFGREVKIHHDGVVNYINKIVKTI